MKEIENYENLAIIRRKERIKDDLVCALLYAGLGIISFGLGAVAAIGCGLLQRYSYLNLIIMKEIDMDQLQYITAGRDIKTIVAQLGLSELIKIWISNLF
jgi:hypothetical protein